MAKSVCSERDCLVLFFIFCILNCSFICVSCDSPCDNVCSYSEHFQQAHCNDRNLSRIPRECNGAEYLTLKNNRITQIVPGSLAVFPFLKYLILTNNRINKIEANTFRGAYLLRQIKLQYNNLHTVDPGSLNGTEHRLRQVDFSYNNITNITEGTFQLVPRMEFINLYNNSLGAIPAGVFAGLRYLTRLLLGKNKILTLTQNIFADLSSLIYLDLSDNQIQYLTSDLFTGLDQLRTFDLSGNGLVSVSGELVLPYIDRLDLRRNNLTTPPNISRILPSIETLFKEDNPWRCDCGMEFIRRWYQENASIVGHGITVDDPVCVEPAEHYNRSIRAIDDVLCVDSDSYTVTSSSADLIPISSKSANPLTTVTMVTTDASERDPRNEKATSRLDLSMILGIVFGIAVTVIAGIVMVALVVAGNGSIVSGKRKMQYSVYKLYHSRSQVRVEKRRGVQEI